MGLLRLILAFSVVVGHSNGIFSHRFFFINASAAVICFFAVSGFYMAFVINEKYKIVDQWHKKFLINRCLRLYPAYFLFLILYLVFQAYAGRPNFVTGFTGLNVSGAHRALITLLNFSIVGQEIYTVIFKMRGIEQLAVFPIAQAWSVAVEIELYLLAAFLFSDRRGLFASLGIGVILRFVMWRFGFIVPPIGCMLVLNVLVFFALGGCAYILYKKIEAWPMVTRAAVAGCLVLALLVYAWHYDGFQQMEARGEDYRLTLFYLGIALAVPFIFSLSRKSKLDNLLGNLSYPIYLCHIFVGDILGYLGVHAGGKYFAVALILTLSYAAYKCVEEPVQRIRKRVA